MVWINNIMRLGLRKQGMWAQIALRHSKGHISVLEHNILILQLAS